MHHLRQSEIADLEKPDLTFIKLLLPPEGFQTQGVKGVVDPLPINMLKVVEDFDTALGEMIEAVKLGTPLPATFFVPDLWHVAKGRAKLLPPEEGDTLWRCCHMGLLLGNTFYNARQAFSSSYNHPGSMYTEPLDEPRFIEE